MVPSSELLERLSVRYPSVYRAPEELNETARTWQIPGYQGSFGFISSMSDHFCATCNRLRITADGQIKVTPCGFTVCVELIVNIRFACSMPKKCH